MTCKIYRVNGQLMIIDQLSLIIDKWYFVFCLLMNQWLDQSSIRNWSLFFCLLMHQSLDQRSLIDALTLTGCSPNDHLMYQSMIQRSILFDDWCNDWYINRQKTKYHLSIIKDNWSLIDHFISKSCKSYLKSA